MGKLPVTVAVFTILLEVCTLGEGVTMMVAVALACEASDPKLHVTVLDPEQLP